MAAPMLPPMSRTTVPGPLGPAVCSGLAIGYGDTETGVLDGLE